MINLLKLFLIIIPLVYCQDNRCRFQLTNSVLPSNWTYSGIDQVRLCFQSNPVNRTVITETIKQLNNSLEFYSFLNLVRRSGAPYFMNVDIRQELEEIRNKSDYQNDYEFHMKIVETWNKLNDFHTHYTAPEAYARFYLILPFILEYDSNRNKVRIQRIVKIYSTLRQQNLTQYVGRVLSQINNVDCLTYLQNFSHQQSLISKDFTVKLNSVFRREFWLRNLAQHSLPDTDSLTITFESPENVTLTLPLLVLITKRYNNQFEFQQDNIFSSSLNPVNIDENLLEIFRIEDLQWYSKTRTANYQLVNAGRRTFYERHATSNTAILRLETFDQNYAEEIKSIVTQAQGKTLILDLIGNEGGHSCLAYSLLHYLVPEYFDISRLYEPMDARITKPLSTFSSVFLAYPESILNIETNSHFTDLQWVQPFINLTRGPVIEEYSMKWSINCDSTIFGEGQFWMRNQTRDKYFSSIYVLTDGTCGSACSLFLSKLKLASNLKRVYGLGGGYWMINDKLFESSSYAGGGAFPWNQIVLIHNSLTADTSSTIDYLPTSAKINVNVYEVYINGISRDYPREFMKQPIDRRLSHGKYFDMEASLDEIIKDHLKSNAKRFTSGLHWVTLVGVFFLKTERNM